MLPYIITFIASCLIAAIGLSIRNRSLFLYRVLIIIAILLPSLLAGFRDSGVGTDMKVYGDRYFAYAKSIRMSEFFAITDCEYGYGLFVYLIAHFTDTTFWMYFMIEFFIMMLIWSCIDDYLEDIYKPFALLTYYLMFYSFSLNLLRQAMAMAVILYSFKFVRRHKFMPTILCCLIASLLQKTSIVSIIIYPIYQVCVTTDEIENNPRRNYILKQFVNRYRYYILAIIIIAAMLIIKNARIIITAIYFYLNDYHAIFYGLQNSNTNAIVYMLYMLLLILFTAYEMKVHSTYYLFYIIMMGISIIMYQLKNVSNAAYRISLYYSIYLVVLLPKMIQEIDNQKNRVISLIVSIIVMDVYAYDFFISRLYNQTYPYTSMILRINN